MNAQKGRRALVVEDDAANRLLLERVLAGRGYAAVACASAEEGWEVCQQELPALLLLDWMLPGMDGLELCRRVRSLPDGSRPVIIVVTARDRTEDLDAVLEAGADDYVTKPIELVLLRVRLTIAERHMDEHDERRRAEESLARLRQQLDGRVALGDMVGRSQGMQQVFGLIRQLAGVDTTVLIEGDTGTGKELVARAIHHSSHRAEGPFLAVNCAGLTESLVASQLFGHRRGAFTGAVEDSRGLFEAAAGGTLFLDEIGDIPLPVQASLLRVLQEREITRVGDTEPRAIDVRVLAATHRDLGEQVEAGAFRADLFYRIRVARIEVPPLTARRGDIPLLATELLTKIAAATGRPVSGLAPAATRVLLQHDWPGNVRELENALEYAVLHCTEGLIAVRDLPPEIAPAAEGAAEPPAGNGELDEAGRIRVALDQCGGNRTAAARLLGISRATLYRKLSRFEG